MVSYAAVNTPEVQTQSQSFITTIMQIFSTETLLKVVFAVIVIFLTFIISKLIQSRFVGYLESANIGDEGSKEEIVGVISRTINILVLVTGFSITLGILGVDLGIFMWGIGFGIGFTLRTFLTNFISGVIVVSQGSYHIGDLIEVGGKMGKIVKINALFTAVEEFDGVIYNIPNIRFFEENVSNYHTNDKRRIDVSVLVDYNTDIITAKKVLLKVASNFPQILPAPDADVLVQELGESGVQLKLRVWIHSKENFVTLKSNLTETVNLAFKQTSITIPYPQVSISHREKTL
jgi:small conductance mechanosensitive channel